MLYLPGNPYSSVELLRTLLRMLRGLPKRVSSDARVVLRQDETATTTIGFVGDIMPLVHHDAHIADDVVGFLASCDVVVGNFEGVLSKDPWMPFLLKHHATIFSLLTRLAPAEKWVLGLANNHAADFGVPGFQETVRCIEDAGMRWVGSVDKPSIVLTPSVTLTAWTWWSNRKTALVCMKDPKASAASASGFPSDRSPNASALEIAFIHWGYEFERAPRDSHRAQLPAGYDAVVGHHSHVAQPLEVVDGVPICWSLGNFVTDLRFGVMREGALLRLGIRNGDGGRAPAIVDVERIDISLHWNQSHCHVTRSGHFLQKALSPPP